MRIIGHRGAAGLAPENTLRAFRTALEHDVDAIEFDVRRTADGVLVVHHDATVDRTTNGTGPVSEMTAAEIEAVDAGGGESIPTVDEVLDLLAPTDVALQIELKERNVDEDLIALLAAYGLQDRAVLTSFDESILETVADASTERAYLSSSIDGDALEAADSLGVEYVCTDVDHASPSVVQRVHDENRLIGFWGVNTVEQIRTVAATDADVLSTDRPDRVSRVLGNPSSEERRSANGT